MTIIYFILILGIVVLVHETGHFIFAKKAGVYVYEFSIGMGPRLFKWKRKKKVKDKKGKIKYVEDETEYSIRLLPIGGYVQMAGEDIEVDENIPEDQRLQSKPWHNRFMVMVAGVMMNFILAIILLFIIGISSTLSLNSVYIDGSIVEGLQDGDKIVAVNGHFVNNYDKLALELTVPGSKDFIVTVKRKDGSKVDAEIHPIAVGKSNLLYEKDYGFGIMEEEGKIKVKDSKVDGLKDSSVLVSINDVEITNYLVLLSELEKIGNDEFLLKVDNGDKELQEITLTAKALEKDTLNGYSYGFYITGEEASGFFAAIRYAFGKFFSMIEQMFFTVLYLFTGKLSLKMLSGPVGIYQVVGQASAAGFMSLVSLLAMISVNVGFINILPLPAFDGSHALFLIIEKIKGSPVNPKVENTIHAVGFILLMILMIYITFNDVIKLF